MKKLNLAIMGAGSVGQVLAGFLSTKGHNITLVARSNQVINLQNYGIRLLPEGEIEQKMEVAVTDSLPASIIYDALFLCMRGDQLNSALNIIRESGAKGKAIVLCMPVWGPDSSYTIKGFDDTWLLFPGFGAKIIDTGAVEHFFVRRPSEIGPMQGPINPALQSVADALAEAGIPTKTKADFGYRYTALSVVGGPFGIAIAQCEFDLIKLSHNRDLCKTAAIATKECIGLIESKTGKYLGIIPRITASVISPMLAIMAPLMARAKRMDFILLHRRKVEEQDRALIMELYQWGSKHGMKSPGLENLLGLH